jgi:hypothetical protein
MNFRPQIYDSGGVAERLIAPVLKTGRPKGLVSSNLTPSATFRYLLKQDQKAQHFGNKRPKLVLVRRVQTETQVSSSPSVVQ